MFNLFKKKHQNEINQIDDKLVINHFELLKQKFPKLTIESLLELAKKKAEWERDTERLKDFESLNLITELKLPNIIIDLFKENEQSKKNALSDFYRCPSEFYLMTKHEQDTFSVDNIIPFLSDTSFYKIYAYDRLKKGFLTYDIEQPETIIDKKERYSWDGIFVSDILFWWECEIENDVIIEFGNALNLKWTEEILWEIENKLDNSDFENIKNWKMSIYEKYNMLLE